MSPRQQAQVNNKPRLLPGEDPEEYRSWKTDLQTQHGNKTESKKTEVLQTELASNEQHSVQTKENRGKLGKAKQNKVPPVQHRRSP